MKPIDFQRASSDVGDKRQLDSWNASKEKEGKQPTIQIAKRSHQESVVLQHPSGIRISPGKHGTKMIKARDIRGGYQYQKN